MICPAMPTMPPASGTGWYPASGDVAPCLRWGPLPFHQRMALDMQVALPMVRRKLERRTPAVFIRRQHMIDSLPQAVLEAADVSAVSQLVLRERLSRDLGLWEQMRDCFHDDSVVRISWITASGPEFVRRSKEMAERNVKASHRLGPILVTLAGDRAIAQVRAMIDIPFTLKATEVMVSSHLTCYSAPNGERECGVFPV